MILFLDTIKSQRRKPLNKEIRIKKINRKPAVRAKAISLIDEKLDWNGNLPPFRGTSELYQEVPEIINDDFDDSEWLEDPSIKSKDEPKITLNNALGSLMSAYNSSDDSDVETTKKSADDEPPIEVKIEKSMVAAFPSSLPSVEEKPVQDTQRKRKRKRISRKTERPKRERKGKKGDDNVLPEAMFKKRRTTLLERLLADEILHERNVLLQCIRYVVSNDFFEGASQTQTI